MMDENEKKQIASAINLLEAADNKEGLGMNGSQALIILYNLLPRFPEQKKFLTQVTLALSKINSLAVENGLDTTDGEIWYIETSKKISPETLALLKQVTGILP